MGRKNHRMLPSEYTSRIFFLLVPATEVSVPFPGGASTDRLTGQQRGQGQGRRQYLVRAPVRMECVDTNGYWINESRPHRYHLRMPKLLAGDAELFSGQTSAQRPLRGA